MPQKKYTPAFKSRIVISILQGDKELNEICSENSLNPNMVRKWKQEFLQNASKAFESDAEQKQAQRKERSLKKKNDRMLKTIGQLTLERDFLQDCFRQLGEPIPEMPDDDQTKQ